MELYTCYIAAVRLSRGKYNEAPLANLRTILSILQKQSIAPLVPFKTVVKIIIDVFVGYLLLLMENTK
jgi:hypothetical protein